MRHQKHKGEEESLDQPLIKELILVVALLKLDPSYSFMTGKCDW